MTITAIFRAGRLRRWHTNADLADTVDPIDGHSGRVARIILALHPSPSVALLTAALTHDDGEHVTGDVCGETKRKHPELAAMLAKIEAAAIRALWPGIRDVTDNDADWLHFADRLDALMWARHHAPHVLTGDGWPESIERLKLLASKLGVRAKVTDVLPSPRYQRDPGDEHRASYTEHDPTDQPLNQGGY